MLKEMDIGETLKDAGRRPTPQRVMILSAIRGSGGHVTAEEILRKVRKEYTFIDIATIYRTLQLFKRLGLVSEIDLKQGSTRYEIAEKEKHHHLVCSGCGKSFYLDHKRFIEPLRLALLNDFGFEADLEHFAVSGLCSQCRASGKTSSNDSKGGR
ncbi:MAG: transcriptional repressor [Chloroflexi bacterium]|nr:transcriptional repressor [Chloroflexota bacterium]